MKTRLFSLLAVAGIFVFLSVNDNARAIPGEDLKLLSSGWFLCEMPGDPRDPVTAGGLRQPETDFEVIGDSAYRANGVNGIYLRTGNHVILTTGSGAGRSFRVESENFLKELGKDGAETGRRCIFSQFSERDNKNANCQYTSPNKTGTNANCTQRTQKLKEDQNGN